MFSLLVLCQKLGERADKVFFQIFTRQQILTQADPGVGQEARTIFMEDYCRVWWFRFRDLWPKVDSSFQNFWICYSIHFTTEGKMRL